MKTIYFVPIKKNNAKTSIKLVNRSNINMKNLKKTLIIGGSSDLGKELKKIINSKTIELNSKDLDLSNIKEVKNFKITTNFDNVIFFSAINKPKKFIDQEDGEIERVLNVNFLSLIFLIKKIIKNNILKKKKCNIIFITSLYSKLARDKRFLYSLSKHALVGLMRNITVEYGKYGIRANALSPGYVDTKMTRKNLSEKKISKIKKITPLRRLVSKKDIALMIKFMLSNESKNLCGQEIIVDAGITINASYGE